MQSTLTFDKCIWAAGVYGKKIIPPSIRNLLCKQNYSGTQIHSSTAGSCLHLVKGKRILIIGDSDSAEDLTLQSLKHGVEKVYILSRSACGVCTRYGYWPYNKVEILDN